MTGKHWGVETALLRYEYAVQSNHRAVAVLDLKSAYQSVPSGILVQVLQSRTPRQLVFMIYLLLMPEYISMVGI